MTAARSFRDRDVGIAVALLACIAYAPALAGTFVYDDVHSVARNPGVQSLGNLFGFFVDPSLFSSTGGRMYRPVLLASFALDGFVGQMAALQFKLTNVLLHGVVSWLVFAFARRLSAGTAAAALAAGLFAVHPLASETVNFVSARSDLLLVLGVMLVLLGHRAWLQGGGAGRGTAVTVLGAFVACGSKETGVVLPALMLLQEWSCRREGTWRESLRALVRDWRGVVRRTGPVVALVLLYLLMRRVLLGEATATVLGRAGDDPMFGHTRDLVTQLATMGVLLPKALLQTIVPVGLSADPPVTYYRTFWSLPVLAGWAGLVAATWLGVRRGRTCPLSLLGTALAWAVALPWIVLPLNVPMAEHRLYGPLAGLALALAAGAVALQRRWEPGGLPLRRRRAAVAVAAGIAVLFAAQSVRRSLLYRDEALLWRAALAVDPQSFRAHWGLGTCAQLRGDYRAAEASLARACELYPGFRTARRSWIEVMLHLPAEEGWPYRALVVAEELTRQKDDDPYYRLLHANAELQVGIDLDDRDTLLAAEARVLSCLEIGEPKALVFRMAAECRRRLDDLPGALAHFDRALAMGLDFPGLRAERSEVLRALGRTEEADRELREAFRLAPMDSAVRAAWARRHGQ